MKIKTFLIIFFSSLVLFAGVNTTLGFILEIVEKDIGESQKKMHESFELAQELVFSSQWLTRFSRGYVATKDPTRLAYYGAVEGILDGKIETPAAYDLGYWDLV
ncbi:MAG: adenylate/guanylate cyclase domain-containing protein, partial [Methylocystis sp.]